MAPKAFDETITEEASEGGWRIVVAGGGTGGHLFPGIAIAEAFRKRFPKTVCRFVSVGTRIEREALAHAGFALETIRSRGLKGKGIWGQIKGLMELPFGLGQSIRILKRLSPHVVIGVGGYAAGPVCLAAWMLRIPLALQEQNSELGLTNKLLLPLADRLYLSFPSPLQNHPRARLTGNPVRSGFLQTPRRLPQNGAPFTVLVCGGSQGAKAINTAVMEAMDIIGDRIRLIHQTGNLDEERVKAHYSDRRLLVEVSAFIRDMATAYAESDLVICRAGASTIAEITVSGKPAILIPFPHAAGDHQRKNALALVEAGAAECILESDLTGAVLAERIRYSMSHPDALAAMAEASRKLGRPDAADRIVQDIVELRKSVV